MRDIKENTVSAEAQMAKRSEVSYLGEKSSKVIL